MNSAKKGLALVISNANYQIQPKLLSCKKDGLDMVNMLQYLNFDVLSATDTTREMLFNSLGEFLEIADLYSVLLVYYTGHGVQIDGENYFVPIDCGYNASKAIFIGNSLVNVNVVTEYMNSHPEKTNIIIMDACRTAPNFSRDLIGTGLAEIRAGSGTIVAFATSPNEAAYGAVDENGNGYYTRCLLNHIARPNIKIEDMFKEVRKNVIEMSDNTQIPWESTSLNSDFYFNTMTQDEIYEKIYQGMRNQYGANMLIALSKTYNYSISDTMRIYEKQKSEKPGGIYINSKKDFEHYILERILNLGFRYENYRWVYGKKPVFMGEFFHDPYKNMNSNIV